MPCPCLCGRTEIGPRPHQPLALWPWSLVIVTGDRATWPTTWPCSSATMESVSSLASRNARTMNCSVWLVCGASAKAAMVTASIAAMSFVVSCRSWMVMVFCVPCSKYRTAWACRRVAPPGFRAAPRADFAVTAIRLQSTHAFAPAALRAALASGGSAQGPSPPRELGAPRCRRTVDAGSARPAPRRNGRSWRTRWCLLRQVVRMRAVLNAGGSRPSRHEGRFTDIPPGIAMELPRHASRPAPQGAAGAFSLVVGWLTWPASVGEPVLPSCGDAEPALPPFDAVRPKASLCCCES